MNTRLPRYLLGTFTIFGLLACMCGDTTQSAGTSLSTSGSSAAAPVAAPKPPEQAIVMSASDLMAAYKNNEVSADLKYKGKLIQVTGKVGDIKKDLFDNIYVTIGTGAMFEIPEVQAFFDQSDVMKAASLSKGQKVTVVGRCDGLMMNVMLKDSKFVE